MSTATLPPLDVDVIGPPLDTDRSNLGPWLAARRRGITGTDAPAILGLSKYKSPLTVYMDKRGEIDDDDDGEAAEWGNRLEPVVAQKWAETHPDAVVFDSPGVVASRQRPWQLVNVDRLVAETQQVVPLEIKTANQYLAGEWDVDTDSLPAGALVQVHHEITVLNAPYAHVAALIGGQKYLECVVHRDEEMVGLLAEREGEFWQRILDGRPPAVDGHPKTTELLGRLYDVQPEKIRVLDPKEWHPLVVARRAAKAALAEAQEHLDAAENAMRLLLGDAELGWLDDRQVASWKANGTFASSRFTKDNPDLAEQYTRPKPALDTDALKAEHPDTYAQYRARVLRVKEQ